MVARGAEQRFYLSCVDTDENARTTNNSTASAKTARVIAAPWD